MKNNALKIILVFGVISISLIFIIQFYWLRITYNQNEREFDKDVHIALKSVALKISDYLNTEAGIKNPVLQLSSEYFVVSIDDTIDHTVLEYFLKNELDNVNIKADFEYGSYNCFNDKMEYGKYISYNENGTEKIESSPLPTHADLTYYFGVNFPNKLKYISKSMTLWTFFSLISIVVLAFFGYSIFTILKQYHYSELQKDFINNMTHEFKTPLSSIKLASDFFLSNNKIKSDKRLYKYSEIIYDQNKRLNLQVENVLQIVSTERKSFQLELGKLDLIEVIKEKTNLYSTNFNEKGKISCIAFKERVIIEADKFHLNNLLHNIVENSIKYCVLQPDIKIDVKQKANRILLSISDNGIGIDENSLKKVFNKFYRVPTGNLHDVKGFGLGLYYVKQICKKHKWKIQITSKLNIGTIVNITMPLFSGKLKSKK